MKQIFAFNTIVQFFLLFGVWLLLSGHYDFTHITMGVISCILVLVLHLRIRKYFFYEEEISETSAKLKGTAPARLRFLRVLFYIPWLIWQIVVASIQVAAVVLNPKMPLDPSLLRFKTKLPGMNARVILGNSITLTPGTITVQIEDDEFLVHALMDVSYTGIVDGSLPDEVAKLYEKKPDHVVQDVKTIKTGADI